MSHIYDKTLMKRGEAARRLIVDGEDPFRMLLAVVWPGHDWSESVLLARLCEECGSTGLVTATRRNLLAIEDLAATMYEAA
jgi:hypothetical protein